MATNTPEKSQTVLFAMLIAAISVVIALVSLIPAMSALSALAIVLGLAAVLFGVLSLREIL